MHLCLLPCVPVCALSLSVDVYVYTCVCAGACVHSPPQQTFVVDIAGHFGYKNEQVLS